MSRRRADPLAGAVSLFPFLAVLICTMGVLVAMLALAIRAADVGDVTQRSAVETAVREDLDRAELARDEAELKAAALDGARGRLQSELQQTRLRRSHLEQQLRQLEQDFRELDRSSRPPGSAADDVPALRRELRAVEQAVAIAEQEYALARARLADRPRGYALIPQPTVNGTLRRPIYLECLSDAVVVQPSRLRIPLESLEPPVLRGNPLDIALLAIREYWSAEDVAGEEGEPYPLLVVRPGGARAYALARRAMAGWDDEFGYELVADSVPLDFGSPDDELQRQLHAALRTAERQYAALRQLAIAATARQSEMSGRGPADEGRTASLHGGFVSAGATRSAESRPRASDETLAASRAPASNTPSARPLEKSAASPRVRPNTRGGEMASASAAEKGPSGGPSGAAVQPGPASLAAERGVNWALPSARPTATAYRRPIRLTCSATRLLIEPHSGRPAEILIGADAATAVDELVRTVWNMMDDWGLAERNGYWQPELRVRVTGDGRAAYEQLRQLLSESGFDVIAEAP